MVRAESYDVVIVGGGHAGAQAAASLRQRKFNGTIAIVGDEPDPPYERPPLSKEFLAGDREFDRMLIRSANFWTDHDISLLLGNAVIGIDPATRCLTLSDGSLIAYRHLIWAAGGSPRRLACSGHDLAGVHSIRNRSDVEQLRRELDATDRVVIIGGGYIGLEAAAILVKLGKTVTLLEAQNRVLARVAGEPLSRFYEAEHRARGVDIRLNTNVCCIEEQDDRANGVKLADGTILSCEMVVVGIGIEPSVGPLIAAGADGSNGVMVDQFCRTSLPSTYAIGDCAEHRNIYAHGAVVRLESIQNATDQANTAAAAIVDEAMEYRAIPWFWSNQYDLKLQTVGLSGGHDRLEVVGDIAKRSFSIKYFVNDMLVAIDCVNSIKDFVYAKKVIAESIGDA